MIREAIIKVVGGADLTEAEMEIAMDEIMTGSATPAQIGAFITALRLKGETVDEITGAAKAMRARATKVCVNNHMVNLDRDEINIENETILDIVGTGGDGTRTFNVSTTTAFVAAGAGIKGSQAWQSGRLQPVRQRGCARKPGGKAGPHHFRC